ncbi:carotenoid biosynthesis protein [Mucilaginibacter terrenus]|uniref:Carotenoid biosynthesis protein n=1 Tax=Mucilaginibacter terrenus TaxID=2482727 RepID=A0A3E2NKT5_9SPHI|nr:carotenoid biosynthesis protein [Mucilaginibacter terrenus]RFZ81605.1 carotenoid biosynthesis protein [Mucilaginibacter terrenus]
MERPENTFLSSRIAVAVIVLFHFVGLVGFAIPSTRPLFTQVVVLHLLLMLLIITLNHSTINVWFLTFFACVFTAGIVVEWIGVHKHWLFGDYSYGATLGTKVLDIPLMIGVNWFLLVYATGVTLQRSRLKNQFSRIIIGSLILVLLDVLIEPVAIKFDYWHWTTGVIPVKNYVCWFLVSAVMLSVFELFGFKKQSIAAPVLLLTQFVFFGILLLIISIQR